MKNIVTSPPLCNLSNQQVVVTASHDKFSSTPGLLSIFAHTSQFAETLKELIKSIKTQNPKLILENSINVTKLPLGILAGAFKIMQFLSVISVGIFIATEYLALCVASLVFLLIGLGLEVYRLIETVIFERKYNINHVNQIIKKIDKTSLDIKQFISENQNELKNAGIEIESLHALQDFSNLKNTLSQSVINNIHKDLLNQDIKKTTVESLTKATGKAFTAEFITSLGNQQPTINEYKDTLDILNEQIKKTYIVHAVGILAIFTSLLAITFSLISSPPLALLLAGGAAGLLESFRSVAIDGFIDQRGYKFDPLAFLPNWMRCRKSVKAIQLEIPPLRLEN